jgi:hypothetical protein
MYDTSIDGLHEMISRFVNTTITATITAVTNTRTVTVNTSINATASTIDNTKTIAVAVTIAIAANTTNSSPITKTSTITT